MALRDLLCERRVVLVGDRRFVVRKPTVETVCLAMLGFMVQLAGYRLAWKNNEDLRAGDSLDELMPMLMSARSAPQLAAVLASCVEDGPTDLQRLIESRSQEARDVAEAIIRAAVDMVDVERLVAFMGLDELAATLKARAAEEPAEPQPEDEGPSSMELLVAGIASHFRIDPLTVMRWPAELLISMSEKTLPALYPPRAGGGEKIFGRTQAEWEAAGVALEREH